jgi:pimeloyl-ACP methyl ester carboxylesterase
MIIYLHGFASAPSSRKAQFFREKFAGRGVAIEIPALDEGDFEHLTITGQLAVIERMAAGRPVSLMGSSLGGYLAALYAAGHPEVRRLVLLAPAFYFPQLWPQSLGAEKTAAWKRTGRLAVFHHGDKGDRNLNYDIVEDALRYSGAPDFKQPALVFHGIEDDVVPARDSEEFAATHPNVRLRLVHSGHELTDVLDAMWPETCEFLLSESAL